MELTPLTYLDCGCLVFTNGWRVACSACEFKLAGNAVESEKRISPPGFDRLQHNDATVHNMLQSGRSLKEIIVAICEEKTRCWQRIHELQAIAPRRHLLPDGKEMVWHCPDHLIPRTNL